MRIEDKIMLATFAVAGTLLFGLMVFVLVYGIHAQICVNNLAIDASVDDLRRCFRWL